MSPLMTLCHFVCLLMPHALAFSALPLPQRNSALINPTESSSTSLRYIQEPTDEHAKDDLLSLPSKSSLLPTNSHEKFESSSKPGTFRTHASESSDFLRAVDELVKHGFDANADLVFVFVGQYHAKAFHDIVAYAQTLIMEYSANSEKLEVVAVLGGGVIGGGTELDNPKAPGMSIMSGTLPPDSQATVFQYEEGFDDISETISDMHLDLKNDSDCERPPSYMVFADPFAPLSNLLKKLEEPSQTDSNVAPPVIAGGITSPPLRGNIKKQYQKIPSLARNGHLLSAGSLVGVSFTGSVGLVAVVSQGCRPVGPTFVVTEASNTILTGLSGKSAIEQLELVASQANKQDQELIRNGEVVCGIGLHEAMEDTSKHTKRSVGSEGSSEACIEDDETMISSEDDFLIRQIMGFQPRSGSIVVAAGGLKEGSTFRFHVRAAQSAREDMTLMMQRAKTERLFAGSATSAGTGVKKGKPLAAFQFSCVARGQSFYGASNVDLAKVEELFRDNQDSTTNSNNSTNDTTTITTPAPIGGLFATGEIGPVGIRTAEMASKDAATSEENMSTTFLHGFTTVIAMLCDYSETKECLAVEDISTDAILFYGTNDAWE